jgi:hypothetical protein
VLDFGLAKSLRSRSLAEAIGATADATMDLAEEHLTSPGMALGTVAYMSPEQALGQELDPRTDLLSFGVVLYEMATKKQPFRGTSTAAIFDGILHKDPISAARLAPAVPPGLDQIIRRTLAKNIDKRYSSARELVRDLTELKQELAPSGGVPIAKLIRKRKILIPVLIAVAGLVLLISWSLRRSARVRWARETAIPEIIRLTGKGGEFDRETQAFGLATTLGIAADTGIAGITLGGGYGWLCGKYGLACDNLLAADVVTADGELLHASEKENPDLFRAVRGGGGNFGVVTSFEYRLHPVGRVLGGAIFYPLEKGREALRLFDEFARSAPDEVSAFIAGAALDGTPCVGIAVCYSGAMAEGEKALAPLRKLGAPMADLLQERSYVEMQGMFDDFFTPGRLYYWKSSLIRKLEDGAIDTILEYTRSIPRTPGSFIYMQQLHGAAGRVGAGNTAFPIGSITTIAGLLRLGTTLRKPKGTSAGCANAGTRCSRSTNVPRM